MKKHEKLRKILQNYGCKEFGDCVVDEISALFGHPTTIEVELEDAKAKVTQKMCNEMLHGMEEKLNDTYVLYCYLEEDIYVIVEEDSWTEVLQVLFDGDDGILFEVL